MSCRVAGIQHYSLPVRGTARIEASKNIKSKVHEQHNLQLSSVTRQSTGWRQLDSFSREANKCNIMCFDYFSPKG